jgi:hypothetical protein
MNMNPEGASAYERWVNQWDEAAWAALPPHRVRMLTSAAIRRELYVEVAAAIAPTLIELRATWSMWEIATAISSVDHEMHSSTPVGDRIACGRTFLFWLLSEYASHLADVEHTPELKAAMLCEHGTEDWAGSTYCGCDEVSEQIDQGSEEHPEDPEYTKDPQHLLPGYQWEDEYGWVDRTGETGEIRRRMRHAFLKAMAEGYSSHELSLLVAHDGPSRGRNPIVADMLWRTGASLVEVPDA